MRIGIIGAGKIGGTLAKRFADAGHEVAVSNSRGPDTLAGLVETLGPRAQAMTAAEAERFGDVVVVSVPFGRYRDVPGDAVAGKVVIDTNNYYPQRDGHIAELDDGTTTSSELLQAHLPDSHVVKVFNNIYVGHLADLPRPAGSPERSALAIAGDDVAAKQAVARFLDSIGYDAYDVGPLAEGWRFQPGTPAYGQPYVAPGAEFPGPAHQATAEQLAEKLDAAVRS
jgi:predicted dinucleotide-binding enzyme